MVEEYPFKGYYAFICKDAQNSSENRRKMRAEHLSRLNQLRDQNRLLLAGPFLDAETVSTAIGSLIIAKFGSLQEAKDWLKDEPYLKVGVYQDVEIKPFKDVLVGKKESFMEDDKDDGKINYSG